MIIPLQKSNLTSENGGPPGRFRTWTPSFSGQTAVSLENEYLGCADRDEQMSSQDDHFPY